MKNPEFEARYEKIFGRRWPLLRESLLAPAASAAYTGGLREPYMMDRASALAALSLPIPGEGEILDACAAPGGKSLVIAGRLGEGGREGCPRLLANELSGERRRRLVNVLDTHLDEEKRKRVTVSGFDAAGLGGRKNQRGRFAALLLDAPCSGERHVLQSEKALSAWTAARPRFLARRQWALLSSAFLLLKDGGSLVYATCALSPEENDGVVSRLFEKYAGRVIPESPDFPEGEETLYGRIILPDVCGGMGPLYVARFKKV